MNLSQVFTRLLTSCNFFRVPMHRICAKLCFKRAAFLGKRVRVGRTSRSPRLLVPELPTPGPNLVSLGRLESLPRLTPGPKPSKLPKSDDKGPSQPQNRIERPSTRKLELCFESYQAKAGPGPLQTSPWERSMLVSGSLTVEDLEKSPAA